VADNITMWDRTLPEARMVEAAKDACLHDQIASRPNGYRQLIQEGGRNFSGGERQRIEIARALVNEPSLLILDEATSALDASTESQIIENLRRRGCTTIIIAHRLSTIRDCDEIVVLDRGRVVERGTHQELLEVDGRYRQLIES
jgi:ABC-type multidrug transport system fused ATPase/permease subunit